MAHDVLIAGALFPDVPSVQFPDSQQQWHSFTDVSDTTAAAADVAQGKVFYDASGTLTQGTASGGGGGGAPKLGVLRPDAELWKSWSYDKMLIADEGIAKPSYSTSTKTLKATSALETFEIDTANYDYMTCIRYLVTPTYNTQSDSAGKQWYYAGDTATEICQISAGVVHGGAVAGPEVSPTTRNSVFNMVVSWSGADSLYIGTSSYGFYCSSFAPSVSGNSMTVNSPGFYAAGNPTILNSTWWGRITDVRYQYVVELYRTPKNNQYFEGHSLKSQMMHAIACAQSATGKLT